MSYGHENDVNDAFRILRDEMDRAIDAIKKDGAAAFNEGNLERVNELLERSRRMAALRQEVERIERVWGEPALAIRPGSPAQDLVEGGHNSLIMPVLQILERMNGSATPPTIWKKLDAKLKKGDKKQILYNAGSKMVREGLITKSKKDGTSGVIWTITPQGRIRVAHK